MASFLVPRMTGGVGISPADQDAIYVMIRNEMRLIAMEDAAAVQEGAAFFEDEGAENSMQGVQEAARRHHNQDDMDLFDEINQHCLDQQQLQNPEEMEETQGTVS